MKKCFALFVSLLLTAMLIVPAFGATAGSTAGKGRLCFGEDGKFTILQVADIQDTATMSQLCRRSIIRAVEKAKPDLVMLTGDNIAGYYCLTKPVVRQAIRNVMSIFEKLNVPVAMVFGNHDDEKTPLSKLDQIAEYEKYSCFIGSAGVVAELKVGDKSTMNVGTYNLRPPTAATLRSTSGVSTPAPTTPIRSTAATAMCCPSKWTGTSRRPMR